MTEWVQPEHRETHEYLLAWGQWLKTRYPQGHCGSMEYHYRSPQCWDERNPRPQTPDESKALIIEHIMYWVEALSRKLLIRKYYQRGMPEWIARKLHFPFHQYDQRLYTARQCVLNLTRAELMPTIHGRFYNLRLPTFVENSPA